MNRIGIICALYFEASAFTAIKPPAQQPVKLNEQAVLIVSGMGRDRAKRAAHKLVEENVGCLVSFGSAGALSPALKPGDLVQPEEVRDAARKYAVTSSLPALLRERLSEKNIAVPSGPLACTDKEVATNDAKLKLFEQTGAIAVDMESAGILDAAEHNGLPACVLRVITDTADMTLPDAILRRSDDFGEVNIPGLGIDLITSPGQIPDTLRLVKASRRAGTTMKLVARELLDNSRDHSFPDLSKRPN